MRPGRGLNYFHRYFRDWVTNPKIQALTREQKGALALVECWTFLDPTPGLYAEDDFRAWAGYSIEEWPAHRERFQALHQVRPDGRWVLPWIRAEALATQNRRRTAQKRAKQGAQNRWVHKEINASSIRRASPSIHPSQAVVSETNVPSSAESPRGLPEPRHAGAIAGELLAGMGAFGADGSGERGT